MSELDIIQKFHSQASESIKFLEKSLLQISVGRATVNMLDGVIVSVYGSQMPLSHLASILVVDPQTIFVTVWDKSNTSSCLKALEEQTKFQISDLGDKLSVKLPLITAEYRDEVSKSVLDLQEKTFIVLRNIRHNLLGEAKRDFKDKIITEDELEALNKEVEQAMKEQKDLITKLITNKLNSIKTL